MTDGKELSITPSERCASFNRLKNFLQHRKFGVIFCERNSSVEKEIKNTGFGYLLIKSLANTEEFEGYLVMAGENEPKTRLESFLRRHNGRLINALEDDAIGSSSAFYTPVTFFGRRERLF